MIIDITKLDIGKFFIMLGDSAMPDFVNPFPEGDAANQDSYGNESTPKTYANLKNNIKHNSSDDNGEHDPGIH